MFLHAIDFLIGKINRLEKTFGRFLKNEIDSKITINKKGLLGTCNQGPDLNDSEVIL